MKIKRKSSILAHFWLTAGTEDRMGASFFFKIKIKTKLD
jgi:hypothetical protein